MLGWPGSQHIAKQHLLDHACRADLEMAAVGLSLLCGLPRHTFTRSSHWQSECMIRDILGKTVQEIYLVRQTDGSMATSSDFDWKWLSHICALTVTDKIRDLMDL